MRHCVSIMVPPPVDDAHLTPLSMTPFTSCTHVLQQKPGLDVDTPLVDDAFALSTTRGDVCHVLLIFASLLVHIPLLRLLVAWPRGSGYPTSGVACHRWLSYQLPTL